MRIGIVGGGVSGSYLASLLDEKHNVIIYERQEFEKFYAVCAWGTSLHELRRLSSKIGLDFDEYVLFTGKRMIVQLPNRELEIPLKGLCTFDKRRFVMDMHKGKEIVYGRAIDKAPSDRYNIVIDATGFNRALLPKIKKDYFIPTLEYRVRFNSPPFDDFMVRPLKGLCGYLWFFPLENGYAHVGAGDYYKRHVDVLREFMREHGGEIVKKIGRPVRIAPPHLCQPIMEGNVIGVGESIGVVYPALGEGIIPGMQCAELLARHIERGTLQQYPSEVIKKFDVYEKVFEFIRKKIKGEFSWLKDFNLVLSAFLHMKLAEDRYGMKIRLRDWLNVVRS
ncbi:MAG: NAD(P)/FAD-dependent oxidoreductase [Aigarchaeota archaeon]|nr:NAD(P)/FAD-dependent oxidoreductase [Candidatus Pelearchaeum maunauluense]